MQRHISLVLGWILFWHKQSPRTNCVEVTLKCAIRGGVATPGAPCSPRVVLAFLPEEGSGTMVLAVRMPESGFQFAGILVGTSKNGKCDQKVTCQLKSFLFDGNQKFFRDMY